MFVIEDSYYVEGKKANRQLILVAVIHYIVLLSMALNAPKELPNSMKSEKATFEEFYNEISLKYDSKEFDADVIYTDSIFNEAATEYLYLIDNEDFKFKERQIDLEENKTIEVIKTRVSIYGNDNFKYKEDYYSYEIPSIGYKEEIPKKDTEEIMNIIHEEYNDYVSNDIHEYLYHLVRIIINFSFFILTCIYVIFIVVRIHYVLKRKILF